MQPFFDSCEKIDGWTQFTMEYNQETTIEVSFNVPILAGLLEIPTPDISEFYIDAKILGV